jgi:hypothetical protein
MIRRSESTEPLNGINYVMMGVDGAEVALEPPLHTSLSLDSVDTAAVFPEKAPVSPMKLRLNGLAADKTPQSKIFHTASLLDDEMTPTPAKTIDKKDETPFATNVCCPRSWEEGSALAVINLENRISAFLSSPNGLEDWCSGWQAWTYFEMDHIGEQGSTKLKEDVKRVLRNRAFNMQSRTRRIQRLKEDICPFTSTPQQESKARLSPVELTKNRTYCVSQRQPQKISPLASAASKDSAKTITSVWDAVLCNAPGKEEDSPFLIRSRGIRTDDEELCYDSDPEEITRRRTKPKAKSERHRTSAMRLAEHSIFDEELVNEQVQVSPLS